MAPASELRNPDSSLVDDVDCGGGGGGGGDEEEDRLSTGIADCGMGGGAFFSTD